MQQQQQGSHDGNDDDATPLLSPPPASPPPPLPQLDGEDAFFRHCDELPTAHDDWSVDGGDDDALFQGVQDILF